MKISAFKKSYGNKTAVEVPELILEEGKIYGIIGPNGSGKSSFAKVLAGIIKPDRGKSVLDSSVSVGYMPQKSYAFRMKLRHNLLLAGSDTERANELMEAFHLEELQNQRADRLSGGETARMALARLMMKDFRLLILDEPTASMDMESSIIAENQILSYCRKSGCCVILVTHSIQQARRTADEILFFKSGHLIERGSSLAMLESPRQEETKAFLEFYGI